MLLVSLGSFAAAFKLEDAFIPAVEDNRITFAKLRVSIGSPNIAP
jgi:hypothetical protein